MRQLNYPPQIQRPQLLHLSIHWMEMLLKVIIFMPNSLYIIMILGLKGLEAAAVTAPGGFELPTIAMKGGNHHRRDFKHRNRNFRRRDNRRHNNGNESSENEKVFFRKSTRTR